MNRPASQRGFTLIELMVALILASIGITAAFSMGMTLRRQGQFQQQAIILERTARSSLALMARAVRSATPGVPMGNIQDLVGCSAFRGLEVTNGTATDELRVVWGSGIWTSLRAAYTSTSTGLTVVSAAGFAVGDLVIVSNMSQGHLLRITSVNQTGGEWILGTNSPISLCSGSAAFPAGNYPPSGASIVVRARMARFFLANGALMMDPDVDGGAAAQVVAPNVEDFQVAIGIDNNANGRLDEVRAAANDDDWIYNISGDSAPPAMTSTAWRALRLTVTARSKDDAQFSGISARPAAENRDAGTQDTFRRRSLSSIVEIRNSAAVP